MINDDFFRDKAQKIWGGYVSACPTDVVVDEWGSYRKTLTSYIVEKTAAKAPFLKQSKSLAIYGAGNCYDLDLGMLSKYFAEIILIDRDERALDRAMARYDIADGCTLTKQVCNIGIVPSQTYEDFAFTALKNFGLAQKEEQAAEAVTETAKFVEAAYAKVQAAFKSNFVNGTARESDADKLTGEFDVAVAAGVHSQINNVFTAVFGYVSNALLMTGYPFKQQLIDCSKLIHEMQTQCTILTVVDLDDVMLKHLKQGGKLVYALEKSSTVADSLVAGSYEATLDFNKRSMEASIDKDDEMFTEWPFSKDHGVVYNVAMGCITKK